MRFAIANYTLTVNMPMENIGMLIFLIALTSVVYYYMRKLRKERTVKLGNFETIKEVHGHKSIASPSILIIKVLMVVMLFLVATGSINLQATYPVSDTSFVLAIDNSQSMTAPDYPPNRLAFAKSTSKQWLSQVPEGTNISVVAFAGSVRPVRTPTNSQKTVRAAISSIEPDLDSSGTAIGGAISEGVSILANTDMKKKIILITDGENTAGKNLSTAVQEAKSENVKVDIIAISSTDRTERLYQNLSQSLNGSSLDTSVDIPEINVDKLQRSANATGGTFYRITGQDFFKNSFKDIVFKKKTVALDSSYYVLIFISLLLILEMLLYSKFGAI